MDEAHTPGQEGHTAPPRPPTRPDGGSAPDEPDAPSWPVRTAQQLLGIERLPAWVEVPDAEHESETERDGAFSYAAEWHAFGNGLYHGVTTHPLRAPPVPTEGQAAKDYEREPHYWRYGYMIGTAIIILVAYSGFENREWLANAAFELPAYVG